MAIVPHLYRNAVIKLKFSKKFAIVPPFYAHKRSTLASSDMSIG
jgi:predicted transcriptional regulator